MSRVRIYSLSAGMGKCVGFISLIPTMIRKEFADIRTTVCSDEGTSLNNVKAIIVCQDSLAFHGYKEVGVKRVANLGVKLFIDSGNGKSST